MAINACWGIEVGAGAVKGVKLVRDGDGVKVADFVIIPHKRVLSTPETQERDAKVVAIGQLLGQANLEKAGLAISIPGHSAFAKFAKLPPADPKSIPALVKFEAAQQIPFPIEEVEWDFQTFASNDNPEVEVGIFAITREKVADHLSYWTDLSRTPQTLTLSPLAAYNAIAYDQVFTVQTPGTVILDIGTISTDLIVADAGRLWIRTFPIGGHQFTEALVTAFNLSYVKAEKLKREAESSQHARHILQAMRPVFADLAQDVQRSMNYYQSLHPETKLTKVVGLGATFALPGLRKFLSQQLGMEVTRLEGYTRCKMDGDRDKDFQENAPMLATATGLALQGLDMQTVTANLMPLSVVREGLWQTKTRWFVAAAALALAAGAAMFIGPISDSVAAGLGNKPASIGETKSLLKAQKSAWQTAEAAYKPDYRAAASLGLLEYRELHALAIKDISEMLAATHATLRKDRPKINIDFRTLETDYSVSNRPFTFTGGLPANAQGGGGGGNIQGGSGEGGRPFSGGVTPPAGDPAAAGAEALNPKLGVQLTFAVDQKRDDCEAAVRKIITDLVKEARARTGLPYTFSLNPKFVTAVETVAATPGGGGGGAMPNPGGGGGPFNPGGGAGRPVGPGGSGGGDPMGGDPDQFAPIPPKPELAAPGSTITRFVVTFELPITRGPAPATTPGGPQ
ncbi:MAG: type IV pilus assembly protein PilM [Phycisphaerales bacterium]|nr:type IV pilus assembly protein PilM [Phycisphaerales bacterium]